MRRANLFWPTVLGSLGILDFWCAKNATVGDSLSEVTRATLRTHTPLGRAAFVGAWAGLTVWLIPHICRGAIADAVRAIDDNLADF